MKKSIRRLIERILTAFAKAILWRHKTKIVVVTGSAGKTTTKTAVGTVLKHGFGRKVLVGYGNLGTISGVPLALLNFKVNLLDAGILAPLYLILLTFLAFFKTFWLIIWPFYYEYIVLELTADQPGDLFVTSAYLKPNVAIVTNVGESHLEHFKTIEGVAREKSAIVKNTSSNGLVILNGLDKNVLAMRQLTRAKIEVVKVKSYEFAIRAASIVGQYYGLTEPIIGAGLKKVKSPPGRFDVFKGINETTLINSTYNANPVSVRSDLERLSSLGKTGRKVIVFGDMLELGPESKKYHQEVGREIRRVADYLITFGPLAKTIPADYAAQTLADAFKHISAYLQPGDVILVKASHGMHLDLLVEKLKG